MSVEYATPVDRGGKFGSWSQQLPLISTAVVFLLLYSAASVRYTGFFAPQVFLDFFANEAWMGIAAVGLTFVILSGGIDLSVGSMLAFTSILAGKLIENYHWNPALVVAIVLLVGCAYGMLNGLLIHYFELAPFLVTLAGMFILRGAALSMGGVTQRISLQSPMFLWPSDHPIAVGGSHVRLIGMGFIMVVIVAAIVLRYTRFGRNVYALGGNESSAMLMGLPAGPTKIAVYTISGFCSALAGLVFCFDLLAADPSAAIGMELDAIAAVVIGGTLLSGGVGSVAGTILGVLILAIIHTSTDFEPNLSSWWRQIVTAALLLIFIAIQKLLTRAGGTRS